MDTKKFVPQPAAPQDLAPRITAAIRALPLSQGWCGGSLPQCPALLWPWPGSPRRSERPWRNRFVGVPRATLAKVGLLDQRVLDAPTVRAKTLLDLQAAILADLPGWLPGGVGPYLIQAPPVRWRPEASWRLLAWTLLLAALEPPEAFLRAFAEGEAALPLSVRIPRARAWDLVGDHTAPRSAPLDCLSPHAQPRMILFSKTPTSETSVPVMVFSYFTQFFSVGRTHAGHEVEEAEIGLSREGAAWAWALRVRLLRLAREEDLASLVSWWEGLTGPEARLVLHLLLTPEPGPATYLQARGILPTVLGRTAIGPHAARTCTEAWALTEELLDSDLQDAPAGVREWILGALPPPPSPRGGNRQFGEVPQEPTDNLVSGNRQNGEDDESATDKLVSGNRQNGEPNRQNGEPNRQFGEGQNPKCSNSTTCAPVPPVNSTSTGKYRTNTRQPARAHPTPPQATEAGGQAGTAPLGKTPQEPTTITGVSEATRHRLKSLGLLGGLRERSEALEGLLERLAGLQGKDGIPVGTDFVRDALATTPWSERGLRVICEALARTRGVESMRSIIRKLLGGDLEARSGSLMPVVEDILALTERHQAAGWVGLPAARRSTPLVSLPTAGPAAPAATTSEVEVLAAFDRRVAAAVAEEAELYRIIKAAQKIHIDADGSINSPYALALATAEMISFDANKFIVSIDPGPGQAWIDEVQSDFDCCAKQACEIAGSNRRVVFQAKRQDSLAVSF